jgi:phosphoglycerate dehydrogenase-like enzyme
MIPLSPAQLDLLPCLRALFYASGTTQAFARPFLDRDISISSAAEANAIPVAEFCLAQILLSCKGAYANSAACRLGPWRQSHMPSGPGAYGATIALVGIGAISRHLLKLLRPFHLRIIAVSNYLDPAQARELGIDALFDLPTAFREAHIVSNHLADKPATVKALNGPLFASLRPGATFINTGRGAQVDEDALVSVLKTRPDLTALLDVQHPEPPAPDSELYTLPNIHLTSHIAGSMNNELHRMADHMIDESLRWLNHQTLLYQVEPSSLAVRA